MGFQVKCLKQCVQQGCLSESGFQCWAGVYRNFRPPETFGLKHQYESYKYEIVCTTIVHFSLAWKNLSNNSHLYT